MARPRLDPDGTPPVTIAARVPRECALRLDAMPGRNRSEKLRALLGWQQQHVPREVDGLQPRHMSAEQVDALRAGHWLMADGSPASGAELRALAHHQWTARLSGDAPMTVTVGHEHEDARRLVTPILVYVGGDGRREPYWMPRDLGIDWG